MTLAEFKSWLDGFSEAMGDAPTAAQWAKIKAKIEAVNAAPINLQPIHRYFSSPQIADLNVRTIATSSADSTDDVRGKRA